MPQAPGAALTVVTGADQSFARCLYQFLLSAERRHLPRRHRFIAYDLGLEPATRLDLERRFTWCAFRPFDFTQYPAHVAVARRTYAWKPMIVAEVAEQSDGLVLWLDSATLFRGDLDEVIATLRHHGTYSLKGQSTLSERCDPRVLQALSVPAGDLRLPERVGGVLGVDPGHPGAHRLVTIWRAHALIERHILPRTPGHNADQSLLGILLYRLQRAGALVLNDDEIDISSRAPVRWMTSRNRVPTWLPRWADPFARAYFAIYKTLDRWNLSYRHWRGTRSK